MKSSGKNKTNLIKKSKQKPEKGFLNFHNNTLLYAMGILVIMVIVSFFPVLKADFVNYDDDLMLTENSIVQDLSWNNITIMFTTFHKALYHPLVTLSYSIEYYFFQYSPYIYHINNLLLHIIVCICVFYLFYILTSGNITISFITALLFSLHPTRVESVAWITERKDVLYAAFYIPGLLAYSMFLKKKDVKFFILSFLLFLLSLLSKPMGVTFPAVLVIIHYIIDKRLDTKCVKYTSIFFILSLIFVYITIRGHYDGTSSTSIIHYSLLQRFFIANYNISFYLYKLLLPVNLSPIYEFPGNFPKEIPLIAYISIFANIIMIVLAARSYKKYPWITFGILLFYIQIAPVSQILQVGSFATPADRNTYLPHIGLFFIIGNILDLLLKKHHRSSFKNALIITVVLISLILMALTYSRSLVWKNSESLWLDTLKKHPDLSEAMVGLSGYYCDNNNFERALVYTNKILEKDPKNVKAYNNRSASYSGLGKKEEALKDINKSIELAPNDASSYLNRAIIYDSVGELQKSLEDYQTALTLAPDNSTILYTRANTYVKAGMNNEALEDYNHAIKVSPSIPELYRNRGVLLLNLGRSEDAWKDIWESQRLGLSYDQEFLNQLRSMDTGGGIK